MPVDLIGLATRKGSQTIHTKDIAARFEKPERSIVRCGTTDLFRIGEGETFEDLAQKAAEKALRDARVDASELTGIYASICCPTIGYFMPGLANVVGRQLEVSDIPQITLSMGCVGGIHGLQSAYNQLRIDELEGRMGTALVLAGDHISRVLDETEWDTAGIFSDGVAAVVLSTERKGAYSVARVRSVNLAGDNYSMHIRNPVEHTLEQKATFRMKGPAVFDFAYKQAYPTILSLAEMRQLPQECYFIPHQASGVVLKHMQHTHNIPSAQMYTAGIGKVGNMTSASVFFGLDDAITNNLAQDKDILLGAFGAELAIGMAHLNKREEKV